LRAARANRVFCADEKRIRTENTVIVNSKGRRRGFIQDRRLGADVLFIRAQSAIRADGFSSAQLRAYATTGGLSASLRQFLTGIKAAAYVCAYISSQWHK